MTIKLKTRRIENIEKIKAILSIRKYDKKISIKSLT